MRQLSVSTVVVFLLVGATLSVAISDFDLLLQHVDLIKSKIVHLKLGKSKLSRAFNCHVDGSISSSSADGPPTEKQYLGLYFDVENQDTQQIDRGKLRRKGMELR